MSMTQSIKQSAEHEIRLKLEDIGKSFPGVRALNGIDLEVRSGEIHAIIGENGAGKSTLMNILSGVYRPDEGRMFWEGKEITFKDTKEAQSYGIAMIHQELSLMPHLSVAENIYIGRLPKGSGGFTSSRVLYAKTEEALKRLGVCDFEPRTIVGDLSTSQMQLVEIAKALSLSAKLLIMDEPTSSLTTQETETLLGLMRALAAEGVSILFISHRIGEVFSVANRLTILRDGKLIATKDRQDASIETVLSLMVGREFNKSFHRNYRGLKAGETPALEARNISSGKAVRNVSLSVYPGEVLALTGLVGAGRTETVETIFGARNRDSGEILVDGKKADIRHPADAVGLGMGLVPEGRKIQGIFPQRTVLENMTVARLPAFVRGLFVRSADERKSAEEYRTKLGVKTPSLDQLIKFLSGGNQQKAIFCRWLMNDPRVLFLDEPTHGIDVGAKEEIYRIINDLAEKGVAVVLISSELPEVLSLADRILVMREGGVAAELSHTEANQEIIMHHAVSRRGCA